MFSLVFKNLPRDRGHVMGMVLGATLVRFFLSEAKSAG